MNNAILAELPPEEREALAHHLVPVELAHRLKIAVQGRVPERVYFPDSGIISLVGGVRGDLPVELGIVGREGIGNLSALLGSAPSPFDGVVQASGQGLAIATEHATAAVERMPGLNRLVRRYAHAFLLQSSGTAVSHARASIGPKLARWLLMARDRLDDDHMPLTHEFLATMLAVYRPSVTLALSDFEARGWIKRGRGNIVLKDREALLAEAGSFYAPFDGSDSAALGATTRSSKT